MKKSYKLEEKKENEKKSTDKSKHIVIAVTGFMQED